MLRRITRLKQSGLSLDDIRKELRQDLERVREGGVDLATREHERIHAEIIRVATREFVAQGYEATHVSTIIKKMGTTPHVFYGHFASKHQLLAECFRDIVDWNLRLVETKLADTQDPAQRLLSRLASDFALHAFGPEVVNLIRAEEGETRDIRKLLEESYGRLIQPLTADMEAMRPPGPASPGISTELLAYSLMGAFDNTQLRASWDGEYTRADLFRAHLWLFLAVKAALSGRVDIDAEVAAYEALIRQTAEFKPEVPPGLA
jgi:AcrR family transcriptional regulator